ncbi:hypothetical protein [Paraburkholderia sp.]|uniref:hypothetical protein n=1 Tax=Paraburkholderia sp. TaxID=1926495 RepID=UPI002F403E61
MSELPRILLPIALNPHALEVSPAAQLNDEQFAVHQAEFVRTLFGYIAFLRENARETPIADAFLATFVILLETMEANAPVEARNCAMKLQQIIRVIYPSVEAPELPGADALPDGTRV